MQVLESVLRAASSALVALFFAACLTGCLYRLNNEQGNALEAEEIAAVRIGQSASEVRTVLGEPILRHPLDANIWVYARQTVGDDGITVQYLRLTFDKAGVLTAREAYNLP